MTEDLKTRADARLEAALDGADVRDPRPLYRPTLRYLRARDEAGFRRALRYFEETLVPAVAGDADPLLAWAEYGKELGAAMGPGRTMELDSTGRARSVRSVAEARGLVLYIPDAVDAPVLVLRYPSKATPAQQAACELLVDGRQTASAYS